MKKLLSLAILPVLLAGCSGLPGSGEPKTADAQKPFSVGVIMPLSGGVASLAEGVQKGVELALRDLPEDLRSQIKVTFEDDQFQPAQTVTALKKLQMMEDVDAVVSFASTTANAIAPLTEKAQIPLLALASAESIVSGRKWAIKHYATPDSEGALMIQEAKRRYKKIAVATVVQDYFLIMDEKLKGAFGNDVVAAAKFNPEERNFKTLALQAREAKADAIALLLLPEQAGLFAKQAREQGYEGEFFSADAIEDKSAIDLAAGYLANAWYVIGADPNGDFLQHFQEVFPDAGKYAAGNAYDVIRILADAVAEFTPGMTTEEKRAAVNQRFHTLRDYPGAMGTYSADGKNSFTLPAMLKVVREDGTFAPLDVTPTPATAETATAPATPVAKATPTSTAVKTTAFRGSFISAAQPDGWEAKEFSLDAQRAGVDFRRMRDGAEAGLIRVKRIPRVDGGDTAADQLGKVLREISGIGYSFDAAALAMLPTDGTLDLALTRADGGAFRLRTRQVISDSAIWTTYLLTTDADLAETGPAFVAVAGSLGA